MTLTIAHRLILGFGSVLVMALGLGVYQFDSMATMRDFATNTISKDFHALRLVRHIGMNQREMRIQFERAWAAYLLGKTEAGDLDTSVAQRQWHLARERTLHRLKELETLAIEQGETPISPERKELWSNIAVNAKDNREALGEIASVTIAQFGQMDKDEIKSVRGEFEVLEELRNEFRATVRKTEDLAGALATSAETDIVQLYEEVKRASIVSIAVVLIIGLIVATLIYRSITRPLRGFMEFVAAVGQGDLTQRARNTGSDEVGSLGATLNEMVENLAEVSGQTKTATENLNAATAELQASAQQQAASTSEQSAAVQQITSTLEEITQSGRQITERAKGITQSAEAASTASKAGLQAVSDSSRAIQSVRDQAVRVAGTVVTLTEKTQSIGEIIASVNEIAERSNLLALNAAIEAASAGEAGASFSIVADEIKNLADQAKEATGQVHGLLSEIQQGINSAVMQTEEAVKRAEYGADLSTRTEGTITELAQSVEQSIATLEQIMAATNQQQIGVEQVSSSVQNIREASEQIAAGISGLEQSAASLNAMSTQLQKSVERYRL